MNLPNKLTVLRLILVPFILIVMLLPYTWYNNRRRIHNYYYHL